MEVLKSLWNLLNGKKMYLTAFYVGLRAALESLGISVPALLDQLMVAFGIVAVKSAMTKLGK